METLLCTSCERTTSGNTPQWRCECGAPFQLQLQWDSELTPKKWAQGPNTLWRYRHALPIHNDSSVVSLGEGATPLVKTTLWGATVFLKQEQLFPTGSFKDRGSTVLISKAAELGLNQVVEDSSGNAGCSIAAYCAQREIDCEILVPEDTSPAKLVQILGYQATLKRIPGSRQDTADAALERAKSLYYASHSWNPYFFQGTKTVAFEIWEDLNFTLPNTLILPVGNGTLFLGAYLGFKELQQAGLIDSLPRLIGIQTAQCAPLYESFHGESPQSGTKSSNLAEGIAIAEPIRGPEILAAVKETGGTLLAVSEAQIKEALQLICSKGFFVEPTSAATIAGIKVALDAHSDLGTIVSALTGHGLKSSDKIGKLLGLL